MKFIKSSDIPKKISIDAKKMEFITKRNFVKYEVKYIHKINDDDKFIMKSNISNFQEIHLR